MLMIVGVCLISTGIAVSLNALRGQYGFSGTETGLITTITGGTALAAAFISDRYFERLGLRLGLTLAAVSGAATFLIYGLANDTLYLYYLGSVFGGFTYALGMILPASLLMRRWFNKSRGLALSISSAGTGLSNAIMVPVIQSVISDVSLQMSFFAEASYFAAIACVCATLIRDDPSDKGLEPYGGKDYVPEAVSGRRAFRTAGAASLAAIAAIALLAGSGGSPATSNIVLNFSTEGMDEMRIAAAFSLYGIVLMFSKILYGQIVDRKGACFATVVFGSMVAAGHLCCFLIGVFQNETLMFAIFILLGLGYPIVTLGYPNISAELVDKSEYPRRMERFQICFQLGTLIGSPIPGIIADATGHYTVAYLLFSAVFMTIIILTLAIYRNADTSSTANI